MADKDYIEASDITDNLMQDFTLTDYVKRANNALETLALERQLQISDIGFPVSQRVRDFCVYTACKLFMLDKMGTNNNGIPADIEKYSVKYKTYKKLADEQMQNLTWQVIAGDVDYREDNYGSDMLYVG